MRPARSNQNRPPGVRRAPLPAHGEREDWIDEDNPVRVIDVFVDEIDLGALGFGGVDPEATGRPSYHPSVLLKLYIYGILPSCPVSGVGAGQNRQRFCRILSDATICQFSPRAASMSISVPELA
jgi:transposase